MDCSGKYEEVKSDGTEKFPFNLGTWRSPENLEQYWVWNPDCRGLRVREVCVWERKRNHHMGKTRVIPLCIKSSQKSRAIISHLLVDNTDICGALIQSHVFIINMPQTLKCIYIQPLSEAPSWLYSHLRTQNLHQKVEWASQTEHVQHWPPDLPQACFSWWFLSTCLFIYLLNLSDGTQSFQLLRPKTGLFLEPFFLMPLITC